MNMTSEKLFDHLYNRKLPQVYRDMDTLPTVNFALKRYLSSLIEGGYSEVLKDISKLLDLIDPEKCPNEFLPLLCESFGLEYFEDIDPVYQRRFLANIGEMVKRRGTYAGVRYIVRVLTGYDVELEYLRGEHKNKKGRHLFISLLVDVEKGVGKLDVEKDIIDRYK